MTGEHKERGKNKSIMCQGLFESTYYSHTNTSQLPDQYSTCQLARSIEDCVTFFPPPHHLIPSPHTVTHPRMHWTQTLSPSPGQCYGRWINFQYDSSQADINVTVILSVLLQHKKSFHHETQCDGPLLCGA